MGLMDMLKTSDPMGKFYAAAEKSNIPQGGVTGAAFKAMFPHGLGNQLFGKEPEPMPPLETPEGTALMADLASNMMVPGTFIGPKGLARLFGDDAAKGMLATAESKLAQGVPKESVFQELGVFKGPEGKWRYEIDDTGAGFKPMEDWSWGARTGIKQGESRVSDPLGVMVQHPELERAYPDGFFDFGNENKRLLAEVNTNAIDSGSFDGTTVSVGMKDGRPNDSTLLHELQHAVQGREDFASGGSPEAMRGMIESPLTEEEVIRKSEVLNALLAEKMRRSLGVGEPHPKYSKISDSGLDSSIKSIDDEIKSSDPMKLYEKLAGEAEARAVQDRMNMGAQERRSVFPEYAGRNDLIIRGLMSP